MASHSGRGDGYLPPSPVAGACPQSGETSTSSFGNPGQTEDSPGCFCCHRPAGEGCGRTLINYNLDAAFYELGMLASAPPAAAQYRTETEQRALCTRFDETVQLQEMDMPAPGTSTAAENAGCLDLGPGSLCLPMASDNPFRKLRHYPRYAGTGLSSRKKCDRWLRNESQIGKESTNLSFLARRPPMAQRAKRMMGDRRSTPYPVIQYGSFGLDIRHGPSIGPGGSSTNSVSNSGRGGDNAGPSGGTTCDPFINQAESAGSSVTMALPRRATVVSYHPRRPPAINFEIYPNVNEPGLESRISFLHHCDPSSDSGLNNSKVGEDGIGKTSGASAAAASGASGVQVEDTMAQLEQEIVGGGMGSTIHLGPIRVSGRRPIRTIMPKLKLCTTTGQSWSSGGVPSAIGFSAHGGHHHPAAGLLTSQMSTCDLAFLRITQHEEKRNCMALAIPWSFDMPAAKAFSSGSLLSAARTGARVAKATQCGSLADGGSGRGCGDELINPLIGQPPMNSLPELSLVEKAGRDHGNGLLIPKIQEMGLEPAETDQPTFSLAMDE